MVQHPLMRHRRRKGVAMTGTTKPRLTAEHTSMIAQHGVSEEIRDGRGYRSITSRHGLGPTGLRAVGFGQHHRVGAAVDGERGIAALAIPIFTPAATEPTSHVVFLDEREAERLHLPTRAIPHDFREGTEGAASLLDVHPVAQQWLADPSVEVVLTDDILAGDQILTVALGAGQKILPVTIIHLSTGLSDAVRSLIGAHEVRTQWSNSSDATAVIDLAVKGSTQPQPATVGQAGPVHVAATPDPSDGYDTDDHYNDDSYYDHCDGEYDPYDDEYDRYDDVDHEDLDHEGEGEGEDEDGEDEDVVYLDDDEF